MFCIVSCFTVFSVFNCLHFFANKEREREIYNYGTLADNINNFFYSVSADLALLDQSLMPAVTDPVPQEFIIEPHQVERKLAKLLPGTAQSFWAK